MLVLPHLLRRFVRHGRLILRTHDGAEHRFGSGADGPSVSIRLMDAKVERELFFNPELATGEAYMDGRLVFEDGSSIYDLLLLFSVNRQGLASHPLQQALRSAWRALRGVHQSNPLGRAAKNARDHYDHPAAFYALWLDETMSYSCGYFSHPDEDLEAAQKNKLRHIAAKLDLSPGMTVAEIGSGWGALAYPAHA
jgi:cyclopropane-fatty-acyl-phospholipid synthase